MQSLLSSLLTSFRSCRRCRRSEPPVSPLSFEEICSLGRTELLDPKSCDLNDGLQISVLKNQIKTAEWFLEHGATNLDDCLKLACKNNLHDIAELLVDKGADPYRGLSQAKSNLIIGMLYAKINASKYKQR